MPQTNHQQNSPLKIVFFGAGAFGLPTLKFILDNPEGYQLNLVITQPDRPAGRGRKLTPTPIADWLQRTHPQIHLQKTARTNDPEIIARIYADKPEAFLVIAFGQKLKPVLLKNTFAINLHGSLLPKYRGAAPIQYALLQNETITGVSVITLAERMDAGDILFADSLIIQDHETAGELHDRLADLGPAAIRQVLADYQHHKLEPITQDETLVTLAPKIRKADGTVDFANPAVAVRARIHGLNPWPGCTVILNDEDQLKIGRVRSEEEFRHTEKPGTLIQNPDTGSWLVACGEAETAGGAIEILQIQPPGKRMMSFADFHRSRALESGAIFKPAPP